MNTVYRSPAKAAWALVYSWSAVCRSTILPDDSHYISPTLFFLHTLMRGYEFYTINNDQV